MEPSRRGAEHEVQSFYRAQLDPGESAFPLRESVQATGANASHRRLPDLLVAVLQGALARPYLHFLGMVLRCHETDSRAFARTVERRIDLWLHPQTYGRGPPVEVPARFIFVEILRQ